MANGDRGIGAWLFLHQKHRQRFAHDIAATADDYMFPCEVVAISQKELLDAARRRRKEVRPPLTEKAHVHGMDAVHIFSRIQRGQDPTLLQVGWQGKLDQDSMKARVFVETLDQVENFVLVDG
jgi:hypothetical protein